MLCSASIGALLLGALALTVGCGAETRIVSTTALIASTRPYEHSTGGRSKDVTARSGALTVRLRVVPSARGRMTAIEVVADDPSARGALGYLLRYGDGTSSGSGAVPQFCLEGRGRPVRQIWRHTHHYSAGGKYSLSVSVYVNCTDEHAGATVSARIV